MVKDCMNSDKRGVNCWWRNVAFKIYHVTFPLHAFHISHVICHKSHFTCNIFHFTCHMSHFTCHISHFICHISHVTFLMSHFTCPNSHVSVHMSRFTCQFFWAGIHPTPSLPPHTPPHPPTGLPDWGPQWSPGISMLWVNLTVLIKDWMLNPKLDTRISFVRSSVRSSVTLRGPPLDSETGWTGELWSKTNLLNWQN